MYNEFDELIKYANELLYRIKYVKELMDACLAYNKVYDSGNIVYLKNANDYFTITNKACRDMLVLETAKLFDNHKDSYSVRKFINRCQTSSEFSKAHKARINSIIESFTEYLNTSETDTFINDIKVRRDNYHAHVGKKYFYNIDELNRTTSVLYTGLNELLEKTDSFCKDIYFVIYGKDWTPSIHQNIFDPERDCYDFVEWVESIRKSKT